jgi:hypothetical protein
MKIRIVKTTPPIKLNNHWVYRTDDTMEIDFDGFAEALSVDAELNIVDCQTAEDFIETFIKDKMGVVSAVGKMPVAKKKDRGKNDLVDDGFGSTWSAYCPDCGKKAVHVVRPGKAQCSNCE